jgi:guanosine-3',5'-bis(diphosphate) 3'-pyrophosphohydrolase
MPVAGHRWKATWEQLPQTGAAVAFAERKHAGQRRSDGTPFIQHPLEVATLLRHAGAADEVIAAGALHDVLEKAGVTPSELRVRFGYRITALVLAVSDDNTIAGYGRRKTALRQQVADAGDDALTLFAADKLSKLRELRRETAISAQATNRGTHARRLRHYQRSLAMLQERLPASPLVSGLRDELDSYLRERPALAAAR